MRKFWRQLSVITLMTTLALTTAVPVFANDNAKSDNDRFQTIRLTFEDLIVSSLAIGPLPIVIVAAVQKVREAVHKRLVRPFGSDVFCYQRACLILLCVLRPGLSRFSSLGIDRYHDTGAYSSDSFNRASSDF
jgi:hypothetical protein